MFFKMMMLLVAAAGNLLIQCDCQPERRPKCPADDTVLFMKNSISRLNRAILTNIEEIFEQYRRDCDNGGTYLYAGEAENRGGEEDGGSSDFPARDCYDILQRGQSMSGIYTIQPNDGGDPFQVYCDMTTDSGGWTVFQRREDGSLDFYRYWADYKSGFGHPGAEFWLGNDKIYRITNQGRQYGLRVDIEDFAGDSVYAKYGKFRIGDEFSKYKLVVESYSGTAGDSLVGHNGHTFSTQDMDNDIYDNNCASRYKGAWWYESCYSSNLNGQYLGDVADSTGITWYRWKGGYHSFKKSEMKLRPVF